MDKSLEILHEVYKDSTMTMVIFTLIENKTLTVTDMAGEMNMTRSNIYRSVRQLLNYGIINLDHEETVKNYVKKYYRLNEVFFKSVSYESQIKSLVDLNAESFSKVISGMLLSFSHYLKLQHDKIIKMNEAELKEIKDQLKENNAIMSIGSSSKKSAHNIIDAFRKELDLDDVENLENSRKDESTIIMFLALPISHSK